MRKYLLISLFFLSSLYADAVSQNELNSIYLEAALFVAVFGIMGIISYIYSNKHAKEYKPKKEVTQHQRLKKDRIEELRELLNKELLSEKEFELLKEYYLT